MKSISWPVTRQALMALGLFGLLWFSWASHARTLFNGLASPLFFALAAYLVFLASQYQIRVTRSSLALFILFAAWVVFVDANSGEFLPALAVDSHWLVLPLASLLIAEVFREYPRAFEVVQVGAALCIINLLLTLFSMAEWFDNWHYPPIFGHIRHLGLSIGFLTVLLFARTSSSSWVSAFFRVCRILGLATVFWSQTRAAMLAWLCCMVVFIYTDRSWLKILLLDSVAAVALSLIPSPAFPVNDATPGTVARTLGALSGDTPTSEALTSGRMGIWKSTLAGLTDIGRLWTGAGGNGFARLQVMYGVKITPPGHVHPHNIVVQAICDWGLIGAGLLASFFYNALLKPVVTRLKDSNPTAVAGIIYLLVTGVFDATLYHLEHIFYLTIAIAYWMCTEKPEESNQLTISSTAAVATILSLVWIHTQTLDYRIGLYWYFPTQ